MELCLSCTGNTELDGYLEKLDNYAGINLCLAKIDGFYFPFDGRLQVSPQMGTGMAPKWVSVEQGLKSGPFSKGYSFA